MHVIDATPDASLNCKGSSQILSRFVRLVIAARPSLSVDERLGLSPWFAES